MIKRVCLFTFFILLYGVLFSIESADTLISRELFLTYGKDITIKQLSEVLEYDNYNEEALIKKAILLDNDNSSLFIPKLILEQTSLTDLKSRYHYISILYRLSFYKEIIEHSLSINLNQIDNADTLYFIADSYIRDNNKEMSFEVTGISKHKFPNDERFIELSYLIDQKRTHLTKIKNLTNPLESYFRLFSRVSDVLPRLTLEILIENELKDYKIEELTTLVGNYDVLPLLFNIFPKKEFNGVFSLDKNCDSFIETKLVVDNGNIIYKSIDIDFDNIVDFQCLLEDLRPVKLIFDKSILVYDNYPYIDYLKVDTGEIEIYDLYKNYTKYNIPGLLKDIDLMPNFDIIDELKINSKLTYIDGFLYSKWLYNSEKSVTILTDSDFNGLFDGSLYVEEDIILYGLRDLDSDGSYDIYDIYENGEIIDSQFNNTGDENWWIK